MSEKAYDEEIAPALLAIGKRCEELGMSLTATVEYAPGERGSTFTLAADAGLEMSMLYMLAQAGRNVDAFMIALTRHCRKRGIKTHSSMYLSRFGSSTDSDQQPAPTTSGEGER